MVGRPGGPQRHRHPPREERAAAYHLVLAGAAVAAIPLAGWVNAQITRHCGYTLGPQRYHLLPLSQVSKSVPAVWQGFLMMFGADYGPQAGNVPLALAHLPGVAVVIAGIGFALWRLLAPPGRARAGDLVADFLLLGVVVNIAAYAAFFVPGGLYDAHELGPVAGFGCLPRGERVVGRDVPHREAASCWPAQPRPLGASGSAEDKTSGNAALHLIASNTT
jgi:hypothetical protein